MAVQARPEAPVRAHVLTLLLPQPVAGVLSPLAHGPAGGLDGEPAWFVICQAPPAAPLWVQGARPWGEAELLEGVLWPAARALEDLQARQRFSVLNQLVMKAKMGTSWNFLGNFRA